MNPPYIPSSKFGWNYDKLEQKQYKAKVPEKISLKSFASRPSNHNDFGIYTILLKFRTNSL